MIRLNITANEKEIIFTFYLSCRPLATTDGPIGLILVPTRELANQIASVARSYLAIFGLSYLCITGGQGEWQQKKTLFNQSFHVMISTPGRFIDLINEKYISLRRVTYVVLDEADRMISLGFEQQIRSILSVIRPDCQLVLFSATFPPKMVALAMELTTSPVRVSVGRVGAANANIRQEIVVVKVSINDD